MTFLGACMAPISLVVMTSLVFFMHETDSQVVACGSKNRRYATGSLHTQGRGPRPDLARECLRESVQISQRAQGENGQQEQHQFRDAGADARKKKDACRAATHRTP